MNRLTFEEHTCEQQNLQPCFQGLSLSLTLEGEERETLGTREIRDEGRLTSFLHQTPHSLTRTLPLTRGTHARTLSQALSLLKMKTNEETSERNWKLAGALELKNA